MFTCNVALDTINDGSMFRTMRTTMTNMCPLGSDTVLQVSMPLTTHSTQSSANLPKTDVFPALPAAKKPTSTVFSPGYTGAGVIRQHNGTPSTAWGAGGMSNGAGAGSSANAGGDESGEMTKGKGKKGKQIVFKWG